MVPEKTDRRWQDLVQGKIQHEFRFVPAGLMVSRLTRKVSKDNTNGTISKAVDEAYTFFIKYEKVFKDDIGAIFREE